MTASALNLDNRTQLDRVSKTVVVRDYGDGIVEVGMSNLPTPHAREVDHRHKRDQSEDEKKKLNLDRSMRRSKATIRRKCMSAQLDYMVTLTTRENITDVGIAYDNLTRFIRLVHKSNPAWKYVAVAEFQKRGAVHFHVAVKGFQNLQVLRHAWTQVVQDGNVRVDAPKWKNSHGRAYQTWQIAKLAGYLTKYISKAMCEVSLGRQRYRVSEGIEIPRKLTIVDFPVGVDWLQEIFDSLGASIKFRHESEQGWSWACSW